MVKHHVEQAPVSTPEPGQRKMRHSGRWAPYLAEGIGTFALVFGLVIMVMIYALGHISGAHFNPAVTLGFVLARHFPLRRLVGYWTAQLVGAVLASACLRLLLGDVAHLGATVPAGSGGAWQSFGLEALLTFFLMFVILAMATDTRAIGQAAAIAIGATVGLEALFAGPISGASMNPARSLGPALIGWTWSDQWVYVLAPLVGAAAGAFVYRWLRETSGHAALLERAATQVSELGAHEER